jgi:hypothetical protein
MEVLQPELRKAVTDLNLAQESKDLLFAALVEEKKPPRDALKLIWLANALRAGSTPDLILLQKTDLLENLLNQIRQGPKEWVGRVFRTLYEGKPPPENASSLLPEGTIRDLLKWVNEERSEKVREMLWAVLLRRDIGLAGFAKIEDVAAGLFEKEPITRNNVIRFLFDHFTPEQVVESVFQYAAASGKRVPGVAFRRYAGLLKDRKDLPQKKYVLERVLTSANLEDRELDQIFSDYIGSLNRFDLVRLLSSSDGDAVRIADLKRKARQMDFLFDLRKTSLPRDDSFRERVSKLV